MSLFPLIPLWASLAVTAAVPGVCLDAALPNGTVAGSKESVVFSRSSKVLCTAILGTRCCCVGYPRILQQKYVSRCWRVLLPCRHFKRAEGHKSDEQKQAVHEVSTQQAAYKSAMRVVHKFMHLGVSNNK